MNKGFIFLASPYSHPLREERTARFYAVQRALVNYEKKGLAVYSPIAQWHMVAEGAELPYTFGDWTRMNDPFIEACRSFHVLELDGWLTSAGVQHEIEVALANNKLVYVVSPFRDYSARRLKDALT